MQVRSVHDDRRSNAEPVAHAAEQRPAPEAPEEGRLAEVQQSSYPPSP